MNSSTKITLKAQVGKGAKYAFQKVPMIMRTVFNLALINGYDKHMRIRNSKGEFVPNSNLMDLLNHAMSVGKKLENINEFIDLLAEAEVDPEWIINENVRQMLATRLETSYRKPLHPLPSSSPPPSRSPSLPPSRSPSPPPVKSTSLNPITSGAYWSPETAKQRKLATFTNPSKAKRPSKLQIPPPPPLKLRPISYTPPDSPPSPFKKDFSYDDMPTLDRMDNPPASPPLEMPRLESIKRKHDGDENIFSFEPENKHQRIDDNKSEEEPWAVPPPDDQDDW